MATPEYRSLGAFDGSSAMGQITHALDLHLRSTDKLRNVLPQAQGLVDKKRNILEDQMQAQIQAEVLNDKDGKKTPLLLAQMQEMGLGTQFTNALSKAVDDRQNKEKARLEIEGLGLDNTGKTLANTYNDRTMDDRVTQQSQQVSINAELIKQHRFTNDSMDREQTRKYATDVAALIDLDGELARYYAEGDPDIDFERLKEMVMQGYGKLPPEYQKRYREVLSSNGMAAMMSYAKTNQEAKRAERAGLSAGAVDALANSNVTENIEGLNFKTSEARKTGNGGLKFLIKEGFSQEMYGDSKDAKKAREEDIAKISEMYSAYTSATIGNKEPDEETLYFAIKAHGRELAKADQKDFSRYIDAAKDRKDAAYAHYENLKNLDVQRETVTKDLASMEALYTGIKYSTKVTPEQKDVYVSEIAKQRQALEQIERERARIEKAYSEIDNNKYVTADKNGSIANTSVPKSLNFIEASNAETAHITYKNDYANLTREEVWETLEPLAIEEGISEVEIIRYKNDFYLNGLTKGAKVQAVERFGKAISDKRRENLLNIVVGKDAKAGYLRGVFRKTSLKRGDNYLSKAEEASVSATLHNLSVSPKNVSIGNDRDEIAILLYNMDGEKRTFNQIRNDLNDPDYWQDTLNNIQNKLQGR